MNKKKSAWVYVTVGLLLLAIVFLLIFKSSAKEVHLSLPVYFILLVICDLGATAFLTQALSSSAEYNGTVLKGNLKVTGAAVIFILILLIGYRYRPQESASAFDLTIFLDTPEDVKLAGGRIHIKLDNADRSEEINGNNQASINNIEAGYRGQAVHVSLTGVEGYGLSSTRDTIVTIPDIALPNFHVTVTGLIDSALFTGYVLKSQQSKRADPLPGALLNFTDFDRQVATDSLGYFRIVLPSKDGKMAFVSVFNKGKLLFSDRITLSKNIQILVHD